MYAASARCSERRLGYTPPFIVNSTGHQGRCQSNMDLQLGRKIMRVLFADVSVNSCYNYVSGVAHVHRRR